MNRCRFIKELSAYIDNELSENRRAEIEAHIRDCKTCGRELQQLRLVSGTLKSWQAPLVNETFDGVVRDRIVRWELERGQVKMNKKTLSVFVPVSALVAIICVVFVGQLYLKRGVEGRMRGTSDAIGQRYEAVDFTTTSYEPYYMQRVVKEDKAPAGYASPRIEATVGRHENLYSFGAVGGATMKMAGVASLSETVVPAGVAPAKEEWQSADQGSVIVIQPALPATGQGSMIIRTADVGIEVQDGKETYQKALVICQQLGGYVAQTRFYKDDRGRESGNITMRIPKDNFMTALDRIALLGKVQGISTDSNDVSQEYNNLKARLDAAMIVYNKMVEALQKRATTIPDAIGLSSQLRPVLQNIEELKGRIETLNNLTSFTTINLQFHESTVSVKVLKETRRFIQESLLGTAIASVKIVADAIPIAITLVFWLGLLVGVIVILKRLITRIFKR